ncbi:MAG: hypothetical protein RSB52_08415 [Acidaminococcaceae bacterium]
MSLDIVTTIILALVGSVLMAGMGAIGWCVSDIKTTIQNEQSKNEKKLEKLQKDFSDLQAEMPVKYVLRDDFIRAISNLENKMDRGFETVGKKLDAVFEVKNGR